MNLNRSFQDQQSTSNWTPSQIGGSHPFAAQSNFREMTFGIQQGHPQAFSAAHREASYVRPPLPPGEPPAPPPAQAPQLSIVEITSSAEEPIGEIPQDEAQSQVAPASGQQPLYRPPPAGPPLSASVSSPSSESNPDDLLDGVSGVENLAQVLGVAEDEDKDEDNINKEDEGDAAGDGDEDEELAATSPPSIVPEQLRTPTAATVENFVFEGQFNSPLPLHRIGMSTDDYALGPFLPR